METNLWVFLARNSRPTIYNPSIPWAFRSFYVNKYIDHHSHEIYFQPYRLNQHPHNLSAKDFILSKEQKGTFNNAKGPCPKPKIKLPKPRSSKTLNPEFGTWDINPSNTRLFLMKRQAKHDPAIPRVNGGVSSKCKDGRETMRAGWNGEKTRSGSASMLVTYQYLTR